MSKFKDTLNTHINMPSKGKLDVLLNSLNNSERLEVIEALEDLSISAYVIHKVIRETYPEFGTFSRDIIKTWRNNNVQPTTLNVTSTRKHGKLSA